MGGKRRVLIRASFDIAWTDQPHPSLLAVPFRVADMTGRGALQVGRTGQPTTSCPINSATLATGFYTWQLQTERGVVWYTQAGDTLMKYFLVMLVFLVTASFSAAAQGIPCRDSLARQQRLWQLADSTKQALRSRIDRAMSPAGPPAKPTHPRRAPPRRVPPRSVPKGAIKSTLLTRS